MSNYTVRYERDADGWWVASVRGVKGCHTQGRTIAEARRRIREALGLFVDHAERASLKDDVRLPADLRTLLRRYLRARAKAAEAKEEAAHLSRKVVADLGKRLGLSVRDVGELVGRSHQRVQQLVGAGPR